MSTDGYNRVFEYLSDIVNGREISSSISEEDCNMLGEHGLLSLLYSDDLQTKSDSIKEIIKREARQTALRGIRLTYMARYLIEALKKENISVYLIKGADMASMYHRPEYRSYSDIDLYLQDKSKLDSTIMILEELGCKKKAFQTSRHHIELEFNTIQIELHMETARAFDDEDINKKLVQIFDEKPFKSRTVEVFGMTLPTMDLERTALYILIHMLQHFVTAGFGIRLLLDFTIFWKSNYSESLKETYKGYVKELGLETFSDTMMRFSKAYIGLDNNKCAFCNNAFFEESVEKIKSENVIGHLYEEVISAGRFGENDKNRIVNLKEQSLWGLFREFNHQTKNNFPRASKVVIFMPFLWLASLFIFLRNNIVVRKTSLRSVLKSSYKRSRLSEEMRLFERNGN